ncbi:MAG TPA: tail fiber domain-containing protein [Chitinophagaceae bacterium]|nr:tail fiber domain-containing protein [Chitinophagaceae bacterium]
MKKILLSSLCVLFTVYSSFAQSIGIGTATPDASAALDITNTSKGLLIPRMSTAAINIIANPAKGLLVYDSVTNQLMVNMGTPAAPNWQAVVSNNAWSLNGNAGINPATQFIGNSDNQPLRFRVNNIAVGELHGAGNVFWGLRAGQGNGTGFSNIGIGTDALKSNSVRPNLVAIGDSALFHNGIGIASASDAAANTAIGSKAMFSNTIGSHNVAGGYKSLYSNTTGSVNTAYGSSSLYSNTSGRFNVALGTSSLYSNANGDANTATGYRALYSNSASNNAAYGFETLVNNTTGSSNTAMGVQALFANNTGGENTAMGQQALYSNSTGTWNTAIGYRALFLSTTPSGNTAVGRMALHNNTTGSGNTGIGIYALHGNTIGISNVALGSASLYRNTTGSYNVTVGANVLPFTTDASYNTAVGYAAGGDWPLGWNNTFVGANSYAQGHGIFNAVAIGESAVCTGSNQVRLGNAFTTSIGGMVGYSNLSDGRFKKNVHENVAGLEFILKLRPVTYQMDIAGLNAKLSKAKKQDEASGKPIAEKEQMIFSGFIAQEVEKAARDAGYDFSGVDKPRNENDLYALRYSEFVVPLVKAVQEQQQLIEALKKQNAELEKRISQLEKNK